MLIGPLSLRRWLPLAGGLLLCACGSGGRPFDGAGASARDGSETRATGAAGNPLLDPLGALLEPLGLGYRLHSIARNSAGEQVELEHHGIDGLSLRYDVDADPATGPQGNDIAVTLRASATQLLLEVQTLGPEPLPLQLQATVRDPSDLLGLRGSDRYLSLGYDALDSRAPGRYLAQLSLLDSGQSGGARVSFDSARLDIETQAPGPAISSRVSSYRQANSSEPRRDSLDVAVDMQPVPLQASVQVTVLPARARQAVSVSTSAPSRLTLLAEQRDGPDPAPDSQQRYELVLDALGGELELTISEDESVRAAQYRASHSLALIDFIITQDGATNQFTLAEVPSQFELTLPTTSGLEADYFASAPAAYLAVSGQDANSSLEASLTPLPTSLSVCMASDDRCGSNGNSTDSSLLLMASQAITLQFEQRRGADKLTQIDDLQLQFLAVNFGESSGFRKGYLFFDTDGLPYSGRIHDIDGDDGFTLLFSPGTFAEDRLVRWKNFVQIDRRTGAMQCPGPEELRIRAGGRSYDADFVLDALCQ